MHPSRLRRSCSQPLVAKTVIGISPQPVDHVKDRLQEIIFIQISKQAAKLSRSPVKAELFNNP
jgi:hypothetical protein